MSARLLNCRKLRCAAALISTNLSTLVLKTLHRRNICYDFRHAACLRRAAFALTPAKSECYSTFWSLPMNETCEGPFSLFQMFWGSITVRPLRSFLSVIAIAIQVILVLMIVGLTSGVVSEWGKRVEGVGADILVQPPNSSIFFAFSSAVMPESLGDQIASVQSVDEVAPTVILTELFPQYSIRSLTEYVTLMNSSNLPQLRPFTRAMVALGIFISFLVVLLNMHTMVMERTREVGILKALGFSRFDIVRMLLTETFILAFFGTVLGIGLAFLTQIVLKQTKPDLPVLITASWIFAAAALALIGASA